MGVEIGPLVMRRSVWIDAPPERVWEEMESFERMKAWFGTGHDLVHYEPKEGGWVETDAGTHPNGERLVFAGRMLAFEPPRELTFESDWLDHGWPAPALITIRLTPVDSGTLVELLHHGFERFGATGPDEHRGFEGGWTMRQLDALHSIVTG